MKRESRIKLIGFLIISLTLFFVSIHAYKGIKSLGITTGEFIYVKNFGSGNEKSFEIYYDDFPPAVMRIPGFGDVSLISSQYNVGYLSSFVLKTIWNLKLDPFYLRLFNLITYIVCSFVVYVLLSRIFDFWISVLGTIAFQMHIGFISYIYEMNPIILSFCMFYLALLSSNVRIKVLFLILALHLNTSWFILFLLIMYFIGRRFFEGMNYKMFGLLNFFALVFLVLVPILILLMHPDLSNLYYGQLGEKRDTFVEKLKVFIYLFTFPHVIFLNINLISFVISLILLASGKVRDKVKEVILIINITGLIIFVASLIFLFFVVNDREIVFDRFSRWRKYFSMFTPFCFFPILYVLGRAKKLVGFVLIVFFIVLSVLISSADFSRDPRSEMKGERSEFFLKIGYGSPLQIQKEVTNFLIQNLDDEKMLFISAPLSVGFPYVLSEGKLNIDYFVCHQVLGNVQRNIKFIRSRYRAIGFDLSCSAYGVSFEDMQKYLEPKEVFKFGEHFVIFFL
ncbi:MAG: hypothetical protein NZ927_07135 [Candidatus Calescibacterium sp.]|nr:hypothetical protein [Candidatus Calescibacterium sp.]MCX7733581.1 hypothetical protein [bacterium]